MLTRIINDAEKLNNPAVENRADSRVGDFLHAKFVETVREQLNCDLTARRTDEAATATTSLERLLYGIFLMRLKRENIRSGTSNIFDVSLANFATYQEFPGISYVELKRGFRPIIDAFVGEHKSQLEYRVRLRHHLKKVLLDSSLAGGETTKSLFETNSDSRRAEYTDDKNKAVLVVCDETEAEKPKDLIVVADNVICTMTLGYLKENLNNFVEPLSLVNDRRRQAVNRLGYGTINKVFFFYLIKINHNNFQIKTNKKR